MTHQEKPAFDRRAGLALPLIALGARMAGQALPYKMPAGGIIEVMPNYRRLHVPGGTYFFTVVTARRTLILSGAAAVARLRKAVDQVRRERPFEIIAAVVLPEHLHMIWALPRTDSDYSTRWAAIKAAFTRAHLAAGGVEQRVTMNQRREQRRGVWQPRFIEHTCRDEDDLNEHIDYIHYNPVKHGLVKRPVDWPYSSIHRYIASGVLPRDWGAPGTYNAESHGGVDADLLE